jgi:hypothetical protein
VGTGVEHTPAADQQGRAGHHLDTGLTDVSDAFRGGKMNPLCRLRSSLIRIYCYACVGAIALALECTALLVDL